MSLMEIIEEIGDNIDDTTEKELELVFVAISLEGNITKDDAKRYITKAFKKGYESALSKIAIKASK